MDQRSYYHHRDRGAKWQQYRRKFTGILGFILFQTQAFKFSSTDWFNLNDTDFNSLCRHLDSEYLSSLCQAEKLFEDTLNPAADDIQFIGESPSISLEKLSERGADVNAPGGWYGKALWAASRGGHEKIVRMLLERGANVNAREDRYGNALQAASRNGHEKIVQMLLDRGADANAQGGEDGNALWAASKGGHDTIVQLLVEKGADVNAQTLQPVQSKLGTL